MSSIKVSELSSYNTTSNNIDSSYVLVLDTSNTVQDAAGSVIISPVSSIRAEFWSTSSDNIASLYSTVQSNSASTWIAPDNTKLPLSGGDIVGPISISAGTITNIPLTQIVLSANRTSILSDGGKHFYHPVSDNNPRTFTIASNATVPYSIGTTLTFINDMNVITISANSDTLALVGGSTTGTVSLSAAGMATAVKVTDTRWMIGGSNIS